ncbi:MAG: (Fe-S)-binding protein, partial [Deltaproteobacteria bacterium]|nr:(Fe-S)-binding protein [Deltaproteobacteria bacterium]
MAKEPNELLSGIDYKPPRSKWMDTPVEFNKGHYCYGAKPKNLEYIGFPNSREWNPAEDDWKLVENWKEIFLEGMENLLRKFRSFRLYMDICVRCG